MSEEFYTVERVAERLALHPKTVLRLIRDGRLRATRIGKAYRVLRSDLEAFGGVTVPASEPYPVRATTVVDVPAISPDGAQRLAGALTSLVLARERRSDPIRIDTAYDPIRRELKLIMIAAPRDAAAVLQALPAFLDAYR